MVLEPASRCDLRGKGLAVDHWFRKAVKKCVRDVLHVDGFLGTGSRVYPLR